MPRGRDPLAARQGAIVMTDQSTNQQGPKRGGELRFFNTVPLHLDSHYEARGGRMTLIGSMYSRLVKFKAGPDVPVKTLIPEPDAAVSWEQVDPTTVVFKMRPN